MPLYEDVIGLIADELTTDNVMPAFKEYEFRGNNALVQTITDDEVLLVGAAGTGKSLANLTRIHMDAWRYPKSRQLIVRKVKGDLAQTALVTFERDVLGVNNPICSGASRENRQSYKYPNGSEIVVGGMDRPERILSAEYDRIYMVEAIEFTENDVDAFTERLRNGAMPFQQLLGDTNPAHPKHHLKQRCDSGRMKLLNTYHKDNPRYWNGYDWTELGQQYVIGKLAKLTGLRRKKFYEGVWAFNEGVVYELFREDVHVIDPFEIPPEWQRIRAIDYGFTNPFVCQWYAIDHDGRAYMYREIYMSKRTVATHADTIKRVESRLNTAEWQAMSYAEQMLYWHEHGERITKTFADHDAEDSATLREHGIPTIRADKKSILRGIEKVNDYLQVQDDSKPRLFIFRNALVELDPVLQETKQPVSTIQEFSTYSYHPDVDGKANKENPIDAYNHGMDALRYAIMGIDKAMPNEIPVISF